MVSMTTYIYEENDDFADVMDMVLSRIRNGREEKDEWISRANHQDIEDAIKDMTWKEQEIIRKFFLEGKSFFDIAIDLDLSMDMIGGYIRTLKERILIWI